MATFKGTLSLSSSDLLSDALSFSTNTSVTASHTTGLARAPITSTAVGTASGQVTLYTGDDYAAIAYLYIKNTDTTATDYIYVYKDGGTDIWLKLAGGDFAFLPLVADDTLKAYATTNPTVVSFKVTMRDDHALGDGVGADGIDGNADDSVGYVDSVDGTVTSTVQTKRANNGVVVTAPSYTAVSNL